MGLFKELDIQAKGEPVAPNVQTMEGNKSWIIFTNAFMKFICVNLNKKYDDNDPIISWAW